ncbi:MAG: glutamate--tRNA ligase [Ruminococcaceae bacterium]|nr:glutamate--tRNA ligase [Oscillospiraceae bacterium]
MDYKALSELLFPHITKTPEDIEAMFPPRELPEGAKVTRFAPSPTGFVHFGSLFPTMVGERLAHQSGGVFYLRIEDTDAKREVEGADMDIINSYASYGIFFDEGICAGGEKGNYGPYRQSKRAEIYQTYAKKLVEEGKAYPCFCTEEELTAIREEQEALKANPGYYGRWAKYRDASLETVKEKIDAGLPFVLRFRSEGNIENKIKFTDLIKGAIEITENDIDHVLLKSDGIPTYHFAHAVDDHLMYTTHVVRGEEWLPSLPFHVQLFRALGFKIPKYLHISQLMKMEGGSKKKLSKRDLGAGLSYYVSEGYPAKSVKEYVMTLLNSNYEEWRAANPKADMDEFAFSIKKMSASGSLFDFDKLNDISKNTIAHMSADEVYCEIVKWAKEYDEELYNLFTADEDYAKRILSIGRGTAKPRKDLCIWKDVRPYVGLFYDELYKVEAQYPETFDKDDIKKALTMFVETYNENDDANEWFNKLKAIADALGFAPETKLYKKNPDDYKGHVGDISMFVRIALTGKTNSPDMYEVMNILGKERSLARINNAIANI